MRNHHTPLFLSLGIKSQKIIFDRNVRSCYSVKAHRFVHALQHFSSKQRCWRIFTCPALAWPSYGAAVLEFVQPIFDAVVCLLPGSGAVSFSNSLPDEELHIMRIETIFNKWYLGVGSSGVSYYQQPAVQDEVTQSLLWFAWKKPHIKLYHVFNGNEMIKLG